MMEFYHSNIYIISTHMLLFTFEVCRFKNGKCVIVFNSWSLVCFYLLNLKGRILLLPFFNIFEPLLWPSVNIQQDLWMTNSSLTLTTKLSLFQNLISRPKVCQSVFMCVNGLFCVCCQQQWMLSIVKCV